MTAAPSGSTGPCSARASAWPSPGSSLLGIGGLFGADWERREIDKYLRRRGQRARTVTARRVRRWLLLAGGVFALLVAAVLGVYVWAWLSTDESTIARALIWRESDVGDQHRFPARRIPAGARVSPLRAGVEADLVVSAEGRGSTSSCARRTRSRFSSSTKTASSSERYFDGATRESLQTSFSAAKSFVSTLVGIAIDEGLIGSVEDPVTDYLPELAARDPRFRADHAARPAHDVVGHPLPGGRLSVPSATTRTRTTEWICGTSR